jgi:competence protein ComEC
VSSFRFRGVIAHRPAVPAAILFILGITSHSLLPTPLVMLFVMTALLVGALLQLRRPIASSILIALAIMAGGGTSAQLAQSYFPRDHISLFASDEPALAWIEGRIEETPRVIEPPPRGRKLPDKQLLRVSVREVLTWNGWQSAQGEMPVSVSPPHTDLATGQTVRLLGRLERPVPAMNPGQFDPAAEDRRQRVLVSMRVSRPYDVQVLSKSRTLPAPLTNLREKSRQWLVMGFKESRAPDTALLGALVFGDRTPALRDVQEDFSHTGTSHLLAANGARVAMLAMLAYGLCRLLWLPPRRATLAVTLLTIVLGILTMPVAQAVRPIIVCAAVGAGLVGKRPADSIQLLALAALALLVIHPLDLYGAGFQLSFVIVLGLILFTRRAIEFAESFEDEDKRVAESFARPTLWRTWRRWLRGKLIELSVAAMVSWLVAIPLVAYHFEQFNLWTVPFSILLTPFATIALLGGFAKLALTAVCPPLASLWASLALIPAASLRHLVGWLAHVPASDLPIPAPSPVMILVFYGLLCLPLIAWLRPRIRWCLRCAPVGGCALLLLPPLWVPGISHAPPAGGMRVTLLFVGAGQCAVVEPSGSGPILVDAGSSSISDAYRAVISPFLRHAGRASIDSVYLSHGDFDHISATQLLVPAYGVREVLTSPHFRKHAVESKPCEVLLAMLDHTKHSPTLIAQGDRIALGRCAQIEVLWPPAASNFNSNNAGLVLRLTCAGRSILFPADIQEPAERELLKHPEKLRSDMLVAPHHGSAESTTLPFIRAVSPKLILSSNDTRLTSKQRAFDAETANWPVYRTSRYGAITVEITPDGKINLIPFRKAFSK